MTLAFFKFFFIFQLFLGLNSFAQDGLDENSFDDSANSNVENQIEDSSQEQGNEEFDGGIDAQQMDSNRDEAVNAPPPSNSESTEFDPNLGKPATITDQIQNLNPTTLTEGQDYYPVFIYEERGRKDPFEPQIRGVEKVVNDEVEIEMVEKVKEGLAKFEVSALTLTAILIGKQNKPRALIKDPTGTVYVIHENDSIGRNNGVVKKIRSSQIVVVEYRDQKEGDRLYTTQVLSLGK